MLLKVSKIIFISFICFLILAFFFVNERSHFIYDVIESNDVSLKFCNVTPGKHSIRGVLVYVLNVDFAWIAYGSVSRCVPEIDVR